MILRRAFLCTVLIFLCQSIFGNTFDITIKYFIKKEGSIAKHKFPSNILGIVENNWDQIEQTSKKELPAVKQLLYEDDTTAIILVKYRLSRGAGCYFLVEGFGHELLLKPTKDTIVINMRPIFTKKLIRERSVYVINDTISSSWFWRLTFPEKHKYVGFFDSIAYLHGDMRANMQNTYRKFNHNLNQYLLFTDKVYKDRAIFCNDFAKQFNFPKDLKYFAEKEIQYSYYSELMEPLVTDARLLNTYPKDLVDTLKGINKNINDAILFKKTAAFRIAILAYVDFIATNPFISKKYKGNYNQDKLAYSKINLNGITQGYIIATMMERSNRNDEKIFFLQLYKSYDKNTSSKGITSLVDSFYKTTITKHLFTQEEILSLVFLNELHQKIQLKDIITKKIVVVDCWATWCKPCLFQMPFIDTIAEMYKDKVQFISLAADQFVGKWDAWLSQNSQTSKNVTKLYAPEGFNHIFFKKFRINAIPRYIVLSKSGDILNTSMPRPSDRKSIEAILNTY
ncbi:MAG: TlpA family protein disulfide reductase [Sphingobacteriia bacterium]|nr:MAG: TlpA family protein disulfide reductase [Sphingobacteriia bacterium]